MYVSKRLEDMASEVRDELDSVFRFRYRDSEVIAELVDVSRKSAMDALLLLADRLEGAPAPELKRRLRLLAKPGGAMYAYIGDSNTDYQIFINGMSAATPIILGEEITHGEHATEHVRRLGSVQDFNREFDEDSIEMLGYLGRFWMARKAAMAGKRVTFKRFKGDDMYPEGYDHAVQLISSGKDIPYVDIFHARDRKEMWDIIKGITGP